MVRARRQYIEDIVEAYGRKNQKTQNEQTLKRLRNVPIQLDSDRKRIAKRVENLKKKSTKRLSGNDRKALKLFRTGDEKVVYAHFEEVNKLWEKYILSLLPGSGFGGNLANYHDILTRANYIGAKVTVKYSRCKSKIGIQGIVALELKNVFQLVTVDNRLLIIEKKHTIFKVEAGEFEIEIYGSNFQTSPPFRAGGRLTSQHTMLNVL